MCEFSFSCLNLHGLRTLAQHLTKLEREMEEREILTMFQEMLSALKYIHDNQILHRCALVTIKNLADSTNSGITPSPPPPK